MYADKRRAFELNTLNRCIMSMVADTNDEAVDAAACSVGALHMNPLCSSGGGGAARAQWSRQRATADFAANVGNTLSLALRAEASDNEHLMVVVLMMKKDGLVLPDSCQEGRPAHAHARSTII